MSAAPEVDNDAKYMLALLSKKGFEAVRHNLPTDQPKITSEMVGVAVLAAGKTVDGIIDLVKRNLRSAVKIESGYTKKSSTTPEEMVTGMTRAAFFLRLGTELLTGQLN